MSGSRHPILDLRPHRTDATPAHTHRLKQGVLVVASLGAIYAIWLSVGLPALPIALGDAPSISERPFIAQIDIPTASRVRTSAAPAKHAPPKGLVRISDHPPRHSIRPASRPTPVTVTVTASPAPKHIAPSDVAPPAGTAQTAATANAPLAAVTSTTPTSAPQPPLPVQPPTITLPPPPQVPVPEVIGLPQAPELADLPTLPQLPLPSLPQPPTQTTSILPTLP